MEKLQEETDNKTQITEKPEEKIEYVEAKILVPKQILEFYKALHAFGKFSESLEEFMGYQLTVTLDADLGNNLEGMLTMKEIVKGYDLDKAGIKADC